MLRLRMCRDVQPDCWCVSRSSGGVASRGKRAALFAPGSAEVVLLPGGLWREGPLVYAILPHGASTSVSSAMLTCQNSGVVSSSLLETLWLSDL